MSDKIIKEEYFNKEKQLIGTTTVDFDGPVITGGQGVVGRDLNGKKFLDFTGQISLLNTGYGPKEVVSAICQMTKSGAHSCISADYPYCREINMNRRKLEVSRVALAEKLIEITDKVMPFKKKVFFEVSGATGVNLAAKIAKITYLRNHGFDEKETLRASLALQSHFESDVLVPSKADFFRFSFLVLRNAFHGRHGEAQLFTNSKPKQLWVCSSSCAVGRLPFPSAGTNKSSFTWRVKKIIKDLLEFAPAISFIFEPIQGEGGINVPDANLLKDLVDSLRDEHKIFIVADEVQTGLGRTGKMFACEHFGIEPDIIVLSKSLGAGLPISAVIVNAEKFPDLESGMHSGSHHATPLAAAAAIANIYKIQKEDLVERSRNHGAYLLGRLQLMARNYSGIIREARGLGLMIGIEFQTIELRDQVAKNCKNNGLLVANCGEKVIRMTPPLIVSIPEIDEALDIFETSLRKN